MKDMKEDFEPMVIVLGQFIEPGSRSCLVQYCIGICVIEFTVSYQYDQFLKIKICNLYV